MILRNLTELVLNVYFLINIYNFFARYFCNKIAKYDLNKATMFFTILLNVKGMVIPNNKCMKTVNKELYKRFAHSKNIYRNE